MRKIRIQLNWHYTILHDDKVDAFHAFEGYFECTYDLSKQAFLILLNVVVQLCGDRQILIQLWPLYCFDNKAAVLCKEEEGTRGTSLVGRFALRTILVGFEDLSSVVPRSKRFNHVMLVNSKVLSYFIHQSWRKALDRAFCWDFLDIFLVIKFICILFLYSLRRFSWMRLGLVDSIKIYLRRHLLGTTPWSIRILFLIFFNKSVEICSHAFSS